MVKLYHLHIINPFNGAIAETREVIAQDNDTAIWIAEGFRHTRQMELWDRSRLIHSWEMIADSPIEDDEFEEVQMPHPIIPVY